MGADIRHFSVSVDDCESGFAVTWHSRRRQWFVAVDERDPAHASKRESTEKYEARPERAGQIRQVSNQRSASQDHENPQHIH